jgi:hypothetical protein
MNYTCNCGREVPQGRECPTCALQMSLWSAVSLALLAELVVLYGFFRWWPK